MSEFVVPIIHLDKPTWVTITIGNTIFGALNGGRPVDWGVVFQDLAQRLVAKVGKSKPTPISPFLSHLYHSKDILTGEEETKYKAAQELINYKITLDPRLRPVSKDKEKEKKRNMDTLIESPISEEPP